MFYIIREAKCDENKVYSRSFAGKNKGYKNLEEAKKSLHKINETERLEEMQEEQMNIFQAKLNGKEYESPKADGYHHVNRVITITYTK